MRLPEPEPGLVIRYNYLWADEHERGRADGIKARPCAVIVSMTLQNGRKRVAVLPITHSPPHDPEAAVEIPYLVKKRLGLDEERSWVIASEANLFVWPGVDLERIPGSDPPDMAYGWLPPRLFDEIRLRLLASMSARAARMVARSE